MEIIFELNEHLLSDNRQKISEIDARCRREFETLCGRKFSVEKLKRDEFATQFLPVEVREKLLRHEGQSTHKVIAAR